LSIAALILLATVPLLHPRLRRQPLWTVLPILVGGICLGIGAAFWVNPTPPLVEVVFEPNSSSRSVLPSSFAVASTIPDVGMFGFLIGALLLVGVGYQLFLAAARNSGAVPVATAVAARAAKEPPVPVVLAPQTAVPPLGIQEVMAGATTAGQNSGERPAIQKVTVKHSEIALPGSEAWSQTLDSPVFQRPKSGMLRRSNR
jgi:hypothetical protein